MFVLIGRKTRTEPVSGGRSRTLWCERCRAHVMHLEHRTVHTATLFLMPVANVSEHTAWSCDACGQRIAEGDTRWLGHQEGTAAGRVLSAVDSLRQEAMPALERVRDNLTDAYRAASEPAREPVDDAEEIPERKRRKR